MIKYGDLKKELIYYFKFSLGGQSYEMLASTVSPYLIHTHNVSPYFYIIIYASTIEGNPSRQHIYARKKQSLSLSNLIEYREVPVEDFPLYVGWNQTTYFTEKLKDYHPEDLPRNP